MCGCPLYSIVGHAHDMELVDDDARLGHDSLDRIAVWRPHVHLYGLNLMAPVEVAQVVDDRLLVAVGQQVEDGVAADVGDHAARFDDVNLVDAHPGRRLEPDRPFQLAHIVAEDIAHRLLVEADVLGDAGEGATQALLADPGHQPIGHLALGVDRRQRLHERLAACLAPPALGIHVDADALAVDRQVADDLLVAPIAQQPSMAAARAVRRRLREFRADVVIMLGFFDPENLVSMDVQDIGRHTDESRRGYLSASLLLVATSHAR